MFRYVNDVSCISHYIIQNFCKNKKVAIDATLGNGHDTDFLHEIFEKVYSIDVQSNAIKKYSSKNIKNVILINDSHENLQNNIKENADCIMYNLGYLPGGDKSVTTKMETTLKSLGSALSILNNEGIITIAIYSGHDEGKKEKTAILDFLKDLPKHKFGVMIHSFLNRKNSPPDLIIVEKK